MPLNFRRAIAWTLIGKDAGPHMRAITRKVKQMLDDAAPERTEMYVDCQFQNGHRWAKMLGFTLEAPCMRKHGYLGNDEALYARIKE